MQELQADREAVLAAVRKNYRALKFASEELSGAVRRSRHAVVGRGSDFKP